jgi:hypothetical protein
MMDRPRILLLLAALAAHAAHAGPVYKSVDRAGNVTYSSSPPAAGAAAQKLEVPPAPSEAETREAQERLRRAQERANELESQRLDRVAREAEAEREREAAKPPAPVVIEKPVFVPQPFGGSSPVYPQGTPPIPQPLPRGMSR